MVYEQIGVTISIVLFYRIAPHFRPGHAIDKRLLATLYALEFQAALVPPAGLSGVGITFFRKNPARPKTPFPHVGN